MLKIQYGKKLFTLLYFLLLSTNNKQTPIVWQRIGEILFLVLEPLSFGNNGQLRLPHYFCYIAENAQ
jgi:hypothetical protein